MMKIAFGKKKKWKPIHYLCLLLAFIPIVSFFVFNGMPVALSLVSMFTEMDNNMIDTMRWNAFENFRLVFADSRFWLALKNTLILATSQFVSLLIALLIAVLLNQKVKGATLFQVIFFIPYVCSTVAISIMWQWIFSTDLGILNDILGKSINWLNDYDESYRLTIAVYITIVWSAPAYGIVMFNAALKGINPSLYEAAEIDGANGFAKFWYITLPSLRSVTLFLILAGINHGLAIFDQVVILAPIAWTGVAGPNDAGLTIGYYIYIEGVGSGNMEYASVMSWFLFIVTFALTYPIIRARNRASKEE